MAPEPNQEPVDNLNTSNINVNAITVHESDSEEEDAGMLGYMPLSQVPLEEEPLEENDNDEEDFEWQSTPIEFQQTALNDGSEASVPLETLEVWSAPNNATNIDLDADKINQVKSAMASFSLPSTAIPDWANSVSEDQWKEQLIDRIKEIQKDKK